MRPIIKICGITNLADAKLAAQLGADMLGFNFYPKSPRYLSSPAAADIIVKLSSDVTAVAVTVNPTLDEIKNLIADCPLHYIQLHGDESPDFCRQIAALNIKIIKALRIRTAADLDRLADYSPDAFLLDAYHETQYGGTGHTFNWDWLTPAVKNHKILLAGGLNPDNVTDALSANTWGLDLCSGVEARPGVKDHSKLKSLFDIINRYYA